MSHARPGLSEPWNVEAEFAHGRESGLFPTLKRSELHLAGMSLASITNMPSTAGNDIHQAPGALAGADAGSSCSCVCVCLECCGDAFTHSYIASWCSVPHAAQRVCVIVQRAAPRSPAPRCPDLAQGSSSGASRVHGTPPATSGHLPALTVFPSSWHPSQQTQDPC
jgi:hypothetical protein